MPRPLPPSAYPRLRPGGPATAEHALETGGDTTVAAALTGPSAGARTRVGTRGRDDGNVPATWRQSGSPRVFRASLPVRPRSIALVEEL
ncbi:hypothetical protein LHJ74_23555 [Streptomyces sp. N2-109]|uniref:Uncharacterized protein n=1 Tax=Streptomyces gossypii TaxID=2883101 RepID=A0ABT2JY82_9ACTN|nr:hypothetical protein [Streptomyces gossypii]MCT2592853.1 hypothetical protein [Streptomyces gossypii]